METVTINVYFNIYRYISVIWIYIYMYTTHTHFTMPLHSTWSWNIKRRNCAIFIRIAYIIIVHHSRPEVIFMILYSFCTPHIVKHCSRSLFYQIYSDRWNGMRKTSMLSMIFFSRSIATSADLQEISQKTIIIVISQEFKEHAYYSSIQMTLTYDYLSLFPFYQS